MAIEFEFPAVLLVCRRRPREGWGGGGRFLKILVQKDCICFASTWDGEAGKIAISGFMCIFWRFNLLY